METKYGWVLLDGERIPMTRQDVWEFLASWGPVKDGYGNYGHGKIQSIYLLPKPEVTAFQGCKVLAACMWEGDTDDRWEFLLDDGKSTRVYDLADVKLFVERSV